MNDGLGIEHFAIIAKFIRAEETGFEISAKLQLTHP